MARPVVTLVSLAENLVESLTFRGSVLTTETVLRVASAQCGMCAFPIGLNRAILVNGLHAYHLGCYPQAMN